MEEIFDCYSDILIHWKESVYETIHYWSVAVLSSSVWSLGGVHRSRVSGEWWRWGITINSSNAKVPRCLIGTGLLASRSWCIVMHLSFCHVQTVGFHKCAVFEIVSASLKLMIYALNSASLEEKDDILGRWEFLVLGLYWGFVYTTNIISCYSF